MLVLLDLPFSVHGPSSTFPRTASCLSDRLQSLLLFLLARAPRSVWRPAGPPPRTPVGRVISHLLSSCSILFCFRFDADQRASTPQKPQHDEIGNALAGAETCLPKPHSREEERSRRHDGLQPDGDVVIATIWGTGGSSAEVRQCCPASFIFRVSILPSAANVRHAIQQLQPESASLQ